MDCKKIQSMIPAYLQDELDNTELNKFISHIDSCKECEEELAIQFLTTEGLNTLETGESFDLQQAFKDMISRSHRQLIFNRRLFWFRNIFVAVSCIGVFLVIILFYHLIIL